MFFGSQGKLESLLSAVFGDPDSDTDPEESFDLLHKDSFSTQGFHGMHSLSNVFLALPLAQPINSDFPPLTTAPEQKQYMTMEQHGMSRTTAKVVGDALAKIENDQLPFSVTQNSVWVARHSALTSFVARTVPAAFQGNAAPGRVVALPDAGREKDNVMVKFN